MKRNFQPTSSNLLRLLVHYFTSQYIHLTVVASSSNRTRITRLRKHSISATTKRNLTKSCIRSVLYHSTIFLPRLTHSRLLVSRFHSSRHFPIHPTIEPLSWFHHFQFQMSLTTYRTEGFINTTTHVDHR